MRFFYATPEGVGRNDENLPRTVLTKLTGKTGVMRFAFDEGSKSLYVQDPSFSKTPNWDSVNAALAFVEAEFGARFVNRKDGDPKAGIERKASSYRKAWGIISRAMREDLGVEPFDVKVVELTGGQEGDPATVKGASIELSMDDPRYSPPGQDHDYSRVNDAVAEQYLTNVLALAKERLPEAEFKALEDAWDRRSSRKPERTLFAMSHGGDVKILRGKDGEDYNEDKIRAADGMRGHRGPILVFSFDQDRKEIRVRNHPLQDVYEHPELAKVAEEARKRVAATARIPEAEITFSFDPTLSQPHVTSLDKYRIVWDYINSVISPLSGARPARVKVAEVPRDVEGVAALVTGPADEDKAAPGLREYRQANGLGVEYPFIAVDNRSKDAGVTGRALLDGYFQYLRQVEKVPFSSKWVQTSEDQMVSQIRHMFNMGMTRGEVVDFFAPRTDLLRRVQIRALAARAWRNGKSASGKPAGKTAAIDATINDWWHIGSEEGLERAQHTENLPGTKPFNLRKKNQEKPGPQKESRPKSYEEMLNAKHDKELGYQKLTEQLLKENRT